MTPQEQSDKETSVALSTVNRLQRRDISDELMSSKACKTFTEGNPDRNEFYSPNYPMQYPNNTDCVRVLDAGSGQIIKLDFRDEFNIEPSPNCVYDFLEVRDGGHGYDHLIGKFCGHNHPPTVIQSKGRHLWVHFHSDENIEYSGFSAVYESAPRPTGRWYFQLKVPCSQEGHATLNPLPQLFDASVRLMTLIKRDKLRKMTSDDDNDDDDCYS
ncbi:neuropilin and tolloid-like protein 1 [Anabrus simplex]|uniref:neuropilin and tolloid-like protein 1 n=1 Tax=Anabrus simplex TaxID=316456 RepID=UPI0035A2C991